MAEATIARPQSASKDIDLLDDHSATITMRTIAAMIDRAIASGAAVETMIHTFLDAKVATLIAVSSTIRTAVKPNLTFPSDRRSRRYSSYSDDSSRSRSPPPKKRERRKSTTEKVLEGVGLGGVIGALSGKKDSSRSRSRDRGGRSKSRRRSSSSSSRGGKRGKSRGKQQAAEALKAALLAGVGEAVRARKEPGGWGGDKGKRVLTAAIAAGGVDGILSHTQKGREHSTRDVIGSAIAGLATNRIVNGPRSQGGSPNGRGRSQSRGGLGDLAAGGALAATGKKIYDKMRSRSRGGSRGRARSRSSSYDSFDSRDPPKRSRSQSVSAGLAKGLSGLGFNSAADKVDPSRRQQGRHGDHYDDRSNGGYGNSREVGSPSPSRSQAGPMVGPRASSTSRAALPYHMDNKPHHTGDPDTDSDSDLGSSSGEEEAVKKGKKKGLITAGLAGVATIHAAHSVYQSVEKRNARHKALKEGDITPQQAKREKNKARLQDVASIGIAALGVKGAYSELKEIKEHREEYKEVQEKAERHKIKRENRRRKARMIESQYRDGAYTGSLPNLHEAGPYYGDQQPQSQGGSPAAYGQPQYVQQGQYPQGPQTHYYDDNPYSAYAQAPQQQQFPPPPVGPQHFPPPPGQEQYHHPQRAETH